MYIILNSGTDKRAHAKLMVHTRGAARKAANSPGEGDKAQHDDVSNETPVIPDRCAEKNKKTGSQKDQPSEDASVANTKEGVEGELELPEELTGMATRRGKLGGERNVKAKEEGIYNSLVFEYS